jgi:hypothetical protein
MDKTAQPAIRANKNHSAPITNQTDGGRGGMIVSGSSKEMSTEGSRAG